MADFIIKIMADWTILPIVVLGAYALLLKVPKGQKIKTYALVLVAGLGAYLIAKLVASVYQPSGIRPFEERGVEPGASYADNAGFPSDHTLFAAAIVIAVWSQTRTKLITVTLVVFTLLMAVGRVLALVHTPLDILGAFLFAAVGALWYLNSRLDFRTRQK
jgi:undecaprenyl-diphosphatase